MLRKLATIYALVCAVGALVIRPPPAAPKTSKSNGKGAAPQAAPGISLGQALKDRKFWLLWFMVSEGWARQGRCCTYLLRFLWRRW